MSEHTQNTTATDVPVQVFDNFIQALGKERVAPEIILRLRKTLLEDRVFSESALKAALFGTLPPQ